jgi:hypothetical protein
VYFSSPVVDLIYLVTSFDIDSVRLTLILCNGSVDAVDDIGPNGGLEDSGEGKGVARRRRVAGGEDIDLRTGRLQQN